MTRRQALFSFLMAPRLLAQTGNPPIRLTGINHVNLAVPDVSRSVDFYQGLFGMPVISRPGAAVNLRIGDGPQFLGITPAGPNAPSISHLCFGVADFNVDRILNTLAQHGVARNDAGGAMRVRVFMRDGTPEIYMGDPDGLIVQLQDSSYCGGSGQLGNICRTPEDSPKKGLLSLRDWSHTTNFVSDGARAIRFYQELFGLDIQAYQGPNAPVMGVGNGVHFVMFAGGGGRGAAPRAASINHLCMSMDNFKTDAVIKALESYGIKPRPGAQGAAGPLVHYISMRMENRGGAKEGTPELYFTDPDGLLIQLQDVKYCGGAGVLGDVCKGN